MQRFLNAILGIGVELIRVLVQSFSEPQIDIDHEETPAAPAKFQLPAQIVPNRFVERMETHWTDNLHNTASDALRQVWYQIADTFNDHIRQHKTSLAETWNILSPPTGSGKTEGTVIYCSMLSEIDEDIHPGAIIVTRLIKDCDKIAQRINEFGRHPTAVSYHSQSSARLTDLYKYPVLVTTHRAYEMALDFLGHEDNIRPTWRYLHKWRSSNRQLVIIDESLDIVKHFQVNNILRNVMDNIPSGLQNYFKDEMVVIQNALEILESGSDRAYMLPKQSDTGAVGFLRLIASLRNHWGESIDKEIRTQYENQLRSLYYISNGWAYYMPALNGGTLNTSRSLVVGPLKGAVVMDATASTNFVYNIYSRSKKIDPPDNARTYGNFTLNVSRGYKVGKYAMSSANNVRKIFYSSMVHLAPRLQYKRPLVICHKAAQPILEGLLPSHWHIGHWGQIDGSNEWKDCDTVIIMGLPYLPDQWAANTYMALQGPQTDTWLNNRSSTFINPREAVKRGQLSTNIIQGINRICTRKVIDAAGNCPIAEGYILLPFGDVGDNLIKDISDSMPGLDVKEWKNFSEMAVNDHADEDLLDVDTDVELEYIPDLELAVSCYGG